MYYIIRKLPNEDPFTIVAGPMSLQQASSQIAGGYYSTNGGRIDILYLPSTGMVGLL